MAPTEICGYHGTIWERPLIPNEEGFLQSAIFNQLAITASKLESVFFCDHEPVAEFFSGLRHIDEENELRVVLRGRLKADNLYQVRVGATGHVKFEGRNYLIPDNRLSFYRHARESGFDGVMMLDDYRSQLGSGHDIAMLNEDSFEIDAVRLLIDDRWTPWLDHEKAMSLFKRWSCSSAPCMECEDNLIASVI